MVNVRELSHFVQGQARLARRVAMLEDELQEARQVNVRVAELCDVVAELLVPLSQQDSERVNALLERYRADLGMPTDAQRAESVDSDHSAESP